MDQAARCGLLTRGSLIASPTQAQDTFWTAGGSADASLTGYLSLPASCTVSGSTFGLDDTQPFSGGALAFSTDPVGLWYSLLKVLPDDVSHALTKAFEFDNGGTPVSGPASAADVSYVGAYPNVQAALDALLYVAPRINSFSNSVGTVEIGQTVSSVVLSWSLNKTMTSLTLDHSIGSVLGQSTKSLTGLSLVSDTTYTLTAGDGQNTTTASTTVAFRRKRYWGVISDPGLITNAAILGMSSEFSTSNVKAITYDCTGGMLPVFAYPASFGAVSNVTVGGLAFSAYTTGQMTFTNASGHTELYNVVRFNNLQTGSNIQVVW